jgi:alkylation response protein AidB-like acyl-CoA dehydrogenase
VDFVLSSEQTLIRDTVRRYCQDKYRFTDRLAIMRTPEGFSREHWREYSSLGWLGAAMPEDVGGFGGSAVETALILEEFGKVLVLEPFLSCAVLAAHAVNAAGSADQRASVLPPMIRGELMLALAHGEANARGDVQFVETSAARRPDGGYVLNGRKTLVLGGASADTLVVSARTAGAASHADGVSLFLLNPDVPGARLRRYRTVDGGQAAELELHDVEVAQAARLGDEGGAMPAIEHAVEQAIVSVCAEAVGAMDAVITITKEFLKTRRAYGTTLSTFQALQHRLADMFTELELSRSVLYRALAAVASGDRRASRRAVSAAKAFVGRSGRQVGGQGVQLHGGLGMSDDYIVGHLFKRLTTIEMLFGSSDFHLNRRSRA